MNRRTRDRVGDFIGCYALTYILGVLPFVTAMVIVCRWKGFLGPYDSEEILIPAVVIAPVLWWLAFLIKPSK